MNWAWASSLDQIWRSPAFPMWMMLAAAGFFGLILLVTLLRAERSVANGALTVLALLAIAIALAAVVRVDGPAGQTTPTEARAQAAMTASLPALSCLDDLAGDAVAMGCEKALFGAPDVAAAAVSTTAARIDRLTALGDAATAEKSLTPDIKVLRKSLERDRYGLVAQVLVVRDGCTQFDCAAFRSLTDQQQVAANMDSISTTRWSRATPRPGMRLQQRNRCRPLPHLRDCRRRCRRASRPMPSSRVPRRRRRSAS